MFEPPLDAPPVLVAMTIVAVSTLGVATAIAPTPPSDARALAAAVDRVAASAGPTTDTHGTTAVAIRVEATHLETRDGAGTHTAVFVTGAVTPVPPDSRLASVLGGAGPETVFRSPVDLEVATRHARENPPGWQHDPAQLRIRHVTWGGVDVTLVGAR